MQLHPLRLGQITLDLLTQLAGPIRISSGPVPTMTTSGSSVKKPMTASGSLAV